MTGASVSLKLLARRILLVSFVFTMMSASAGAQELIATLPAGSRPLSATANPATNQIYVPNSSGKTVTVINGTTLATTTLSVGNNPYFAAANPANNKVYVSNFGSNSVNVIDGANNSIIKTVKVGSGPTALAVNPVTNQVYVINYSSYSVSVIDGASNSVVRTINVGFDPNSLAVNPVTNKVYVTNEGSDNVSIIDGAGKSFKTVAVGHFPNGIAVNPVTNQIYVGNYGGRSVSIIDGGSDSVVKTIAVEALPYSLAVNPITNRIYVANYYSNSVSVIDGASSSVIKTVAVQGGPFSPVINPVTNHVYVGSFDGNTVSVIDGASNSVIKTIVVGSQPYVMAVSPATNRVYVPNFTGDSVSVIAGANPTALQFVAVAPCRLVDTRWGSPIQGGAAPSYSIPQLGGCNIPTTAAAYSLNVTAIPQVRLGYLTLWPTGHDQPRVSTMNSVDGRVKANAAIVPAGYQGAVSVFASDATHLVMDIDGYFAPVSASTLAFYPLTPCRVADTRKAKGQLGGPYLQAGVERDFPVPASPCNIPSTAQAYSLNFTAVPHGPLGYLTVWPLGQTRPNVSTLNAPTGAVTANAAIVSAGYVGNLAVFPSNDTDLVIDVNGYFAPAGAGGLSLYPSAPCRVLDTRRTTGPFQGTIGFDFPDSVCGPPPEAQAYVFNATVVPPGALGYLTLWPNGQSQPLVSTLNALDGAVTSNMAIVPTHNGWIDAFASDPTQLIIDISSYFAP